MLIGLNSSTAEIREELLLSEFPFVRDELMEEDKERRDIVSGKVMECSEMLRFAITIDDMIIPDFKKQLPGKGVYVACSKSSLSTAIEKNLFAKAIGKKVKLPSDFLKMVENLLRNKGLKAICLAKKAGNLLTGFEKVADALKKDKVAFLLEAKNAGEDGHEKLLSLAKDLKVFMLYEVEELDEALNRVNTVHLAFLKNDIAKMVYNDLEKLDKFLNS